MFPLGLWLLFRWNATTTVSLLWHVSGISTVIAIDMTADASFVFWKNNSVLKDLLGIRASLSGHHWLCSSMNHFCFTEHFHMSIGKYLQTYLRFQLLFVLVFHWREVCSMSYSFCNWLSLQPIRLNFCSFINICGNYRLEILFFNSWDSEAGMDFVILLSHIWGFASFMLNQDSECSQKYAIGINILFPSSLQRRANLSYVVTYIYKLHSYLSFPK